MRIEVDGRFDDAAFQLVDDDKRTLGRGENRREQGGTFKNP